MSSLDAEFKRPKRKPHRSCDHVGCTFVGKTLTELMSHVTTAHDGPPERMVSCWRCVTEHLVKDPCPSCGFIIPVGEDGRIDVSRLQP